MTDKLSEGRGLRYTPVQLWFAAGRTRLSDPNLRVRRIRALALLLVAVVALVASAMQLVRVPIALLCAALALIIGHLMMRVFHSRLLRSAPIRIPVDYHDFRSKVRDRWTSVYGEPPPGWVDETAPLPQVRQPRYAVLSPDRSVLVCLAANDLVGKRELALAQRIEELPPAVPVILLHDASVPGLIFAHEARNALGSRLFEAGLRPAKVLARGQLLQLREGAPRRADLDQLRGEELSKEEIDWLTGGWSSPIAALRPAKILTLVDRSIDRIDHSLDPGRTQARSVGFLTWPTG